MVTLDDNCIYDCGVVGEKPNFDDCRLYCLILAKLSSLMVRFGVCLPNMSYEKSSKEGESFLELTETPPAPTLASFCVIESKNEWLSMASHPKRCVMSGWRSSDRSELKYR